MGTRQPGLENGTAHRAGRVRPGSNRPRAGTWCEAWTVRDIVTHQSGNAEELARVLGAHLAGDPVSTRGFEQREAPFCALCDDDLWSAFTDRHLGTALARLTEPWMTDHSVYAVGTPLLTRGVKELGADERLFARLRVPGRDDVALTADPGRTTIELASPDGQATLETDAAARVLLLWRRRPADPSRICSQAGPDTLGRLRRLLSGY